ncbi:MAG: hypothetical protein MdMp024_0198 [Bacteroidales bacterium]
MWREMLKAYLTPQGLSAMFQGIIVIFICVFLFFHKGITRQIVEEAGVATKADIEELRKELKEEIRSMKENDLFHMNMAILLLARDAAKSEDRFNRIKDMLIEATPESKRPQMREITFR